MYYCERLFWGVMAIVLGAWLLVTSGCASAISSARTVTMTAAEAVVATDAPLANGYTRAAAEALEASATILEYRVAISPWESVVKAQRAAVAALLASEAAIDTWEHAGNKASFVAIIGCAARAVSRLIDLARDVGLSVPALVVNTAELLRQYLGANCVEATP